MDREPTTGFELADAIYDVMKQWEEGNIGLQGLDEMCMQVWFLIRNFQKRRYDPQNEPF